MSLRSSATTMSGELRYGTIWTSSFAVSRSSSAPRFCVPPTLMVPMLSLPGLALGRRDEVGRAS
jgi:hypothetical protein